MGCDIKVDHVKVTGKQYDKCFKFRHHTDVILSMTADKSNAYNIYITRAVAQRLISELTEVLEENDQENFR